MASALNAAAVVAASEATVAGAPLSAPPLDSRKRTRNPRRRQKQIHRNWNPRWCGE